MPALFKVLNTGTGLSYQGRPRLGWRRYGIAPAGAMDPRCAQLANTLVENYHSETVIELAAGGAILECLEDCWIAHAGALDSSEIPPYSARCLKAGETLRFLPSNKGVWSYLAIHGGWSATETFGSSSHHSRSGLGDVIEKGSSLCGAQNIDLYPRVSRRLTHPDDRPTFESSIIRLHKGPHFDSFSDTNSLVEKTFSISPHSDRSGYRLNESLPPSSLKNLKSLPTLPGCMQVTADGTTIITLHDGPTVGGYPIIAIVDPDDLHRVTQTQPHHSLSFTWHDSTPS